MQKLLIGLVTLLICAHGALAGNFIYKAANGDIPNASAGPILRVSNQTLVANFPYTAMRALTAGGHFTINATYPTDATGSGLFYPTFTGIFPDSGSGNVCSKVCGVVVKTGQNRGSANPTTCWTATTPYGGQGDQNVMIFNPQTFVQLLDVNGTACTPIGCGGSDIIWDVSRETSGCTGNSTFNFDYLTTQFGYQ